MSNDSGSLFTDEDGDAEASRLFEQSRNIDPYPGIDSALLNSADVEAYVRATGMISPFNLGDKKLKSASYEVDLSGWMHVWENNKCTRVVVELLEEGQQFVLKKNSIAFFYTKTKFRIPDYIALRFNLKITHVHRGLLLGTGPLVDPGYEGSLLVPLHNLTSNDYTFTVGEGLIWVEFTKLSNHRNWHKGYPLRHRYEYRQFRSKKNPDAVAFLDKAHKGAITSSIPDAIDFTKDEAQRAADQAQSAKTEAENIHKTFRKYSLAGALAVGISLVTIVYSTYNLVHDSASYISTAQQQLTSAQVQLATLQKNQDQLMIDYKSQQEELRKLKIALSKKAPPPGKCNSEIKTGENPKATDTKGCNNVR